MFGKDTFSWGTKFGGEHFPETPFMPFLSRTSVSCQPHRRWIKSIGLLFLLHNAGSVSVLTDPQLINGQYRLLWSWQQVDYQVSCIGVQTGNTCWSDFNWKRKILWKCGRSEAGLQMRKASAQCGRVGKSVYMYIVNFSLYCTALDSMLLHQGTYRWLSARLQYLHC